MSIGIVIVSWKSSSSSYELAQQMAEMDPAWQVVLVDNECKQTRGAMKTNIHLLPQEANLGFAGAHNIAVEFLTSKNIKHALFVNHDVQIDRLTIQSLANRCFKTNEVCCIGPLIKEKDRTYAGGRDILKGLQTRCDWDGKQGLFEVEYCIGAVMMVNVEMYQKLGGLDTDFFFSGEVADYAKRAKANGYRCLVDTRFSAEHFAEENEYRANLYTYYNYRNRLLYAKKHGDNRQFFHWQLKLLKEGMYRLFRFEFPMARAVLLALKDGSCGRFGNRNAYFVRS